MNKRKATRGSNAFKKTILATVIAGMCAVPAAYADDDDDGSEYEQKSQGIDAKKERKRHHQDNDDGSDVTHITFIHTSDLHGDFHDHANPRDGQPSEGGLARVATVIKKIRNKAENSLYVHTGDTIQGSAQALFTRGKAMVDVMNLLGVEAFAPGNWEFTYGVGRFREIFLGANGNAPLADWGISAVNAYYNGDPGNTTGVFADSAAPYPVSNAGKRLVAPYGGKPYRVVTIDGVKVGIFGCTTNRGPQVVGSNVTSGITFSNCKGTIAAAAAAATNSGIIVLDANGNPVIGADGKPVRTFAVDPEIPKYVDVLRNQEGADVVILLSEAGLAENIYNAEHYDGIDVIFSSDMHEETNYPVEVTTPSGGTTLVLENGEDGAQVGELRFKLKKKAGETRYTVEKWKWKEHDVTDEIKEDAAVEAKIHEVTAPFEGATFDPSKFEANPFNGTKPSVPLDTVVGSTEIEISRHRYSFEHPTTTGHQPGVIEGTGHALITDAFRHFALNTPVADDATQRTYAQIDAGTTKFTIGAIRGFRYVNSYPPGSDITYEDLYHFLSIGPQVAVADVTAGQLNNQSESAADSCMNPDVTKWAGGWMFNFSGVTIDMNPYLSNVQVGGTNPATNLISQGRVFNIKLGRTSISDPAAGSALVDGANARTMRYASYFYDTDPQKVNNIDINVSNPTTGAPITRPDSIRVLMRNTELNRFELVKVNCAQATTPVTYALCPIDAKYKKVDSVDVVAAYVKDVLGGVITAANLPYPRINLSDGTNPVFLPDTRPRLGFPTVEPVWGARAAGTPEFNATYGDVRYTPDQYDQD
jgi:2',3'-cyclic-nucleotide 2'-phosphodiesterase (5'-nucleotidase family)